MTTELVPASDTGALEADPVQYMAVVLNRAKQWLTEAESIDAVRNTKAIAVGYEAVLREKELAFDAQLSATEIVRRCDRRIGQLVKEGQARGEIRTVADGGAPSHSTGSPDERSTKPSPNDYFDHPTIRAASYEMAQASDDAFDQAIADAREEGNLGRANVVRKIKGETPPERQRRKPANPSLDTEKGRVNAAAQARRFTDLTHALAGYAQGIESLDIALIRAAMEPEELDEWTRSLGASLNKLRRFRSDLQEGRN